MRYYLEREHYTEFLAGKPALAPETYSINDVATGRDPVVSLKFRVFKVVFDYGCAIVALPLIAVIALFLLIANPLFNRGPLFFKQERLGLKGRPFQMWKFRTMVPSGQSVRHANDSLDEDRITALGRVLRRTRIDELPNFFNVLRGEMSVVGPRPEAASHQIYYEARIRGFKERLRVKPGITGLAQVEQGYVDTLDAAAVKAKYDNIYVQRLCGRLELYVIFRTFKVLLHGAGAR